MKMLYSRLAQKQKDEQKAKSAAIEKKKIEWGSQIRSYVLHPYKMVKDHRTDIESPQPDLVLDGDLMDFIEAYLIDLGKAS
jgi:peptide chain release factor 2